MTDPVTNVEIEDVLSSIRRLVSENTRGATPEPAGEGEPLSFENLTDATPAETSDGGEEAFSPSEAQMLVLTPALRVNDDVVDATSDEADEPHNQDVEEHTVIDALDAVAKEAAEQHAIELAVEDMVHDAVEEAMGLQNAPDEPEPSEAGDEPVFTHFDGDDQSNDLGTLEDRIAGLEAAVAERDDDWEPDGVTEDDNAGAPVETLNWDDGGLSLEGFEVTPEEPAQDVEMIDSGAPQTEAEPTETNVSDEGLGIDAGPSDAEHDLPEAGFADPSLAQNLGADQLGLAGDTMAIDEDVLRDMVAEIVRQELQGSLGERITRNVRKLVRREIHRALAARDLD